MVYRRRKGQLKKRWNVSANAFGYNLNMGSTKAKRGLATAVKKIVKRSILEPKMYQAPEATAAAVLHNTLYSINLFSGIAKGTDEDNRIGDYTNIKSVSIKLFTEGLTAGAIAPVIYRVLVLKSKVANATAGWLSSHIGSTQIFYNYGNGLCAQWNAQKVHVLCEKQYTVHPQFNLDKPFSVHHFSCPIGQFVFDDQGSDNLGRYWNYYMVVIPYQQGGTDGVTVLGDLTVNWIVSFTDSK